MYRFIDCCSRKLSIGCSNKAYTKKQIARGLRFENRY